MANWHHKKCLPVHPTTTLEGSMGTYGDAVTSVTTATSGVTSTSFKGDHSEGVTSTRTQGLYVFVCVNINKSITKITSSKNTSSAVQRSAVRCGATQCIAVQCSAMQCSAPKCSSVQMSRAEQYSAVQLTTSTLYIHVCKCNCKCVSLCSTHVSNRGVHNIAFVNSANN